MLESEGSSFEIFKNCESAVGRSASIIFQDINIKSALFANGILQNCTSSNIERSVFKIPSKNRPILSLFS